MLSGSSGTLKEKIAAYEMNLLSGNLKTRITITKIGPVVFIKRRSLGFRSVSVQPGTTITRSSIAEHEVDHTLTRYLLAQEMTCRRTLATRSRSVLPLVSGRGGSRSGDGSPSDS